MTINTDEIRHGDTAEQRGLDERAGTGSEHHNVIGTEEASEITPSEMGIAIAREASANDGADCSTDNAGPTKAGESQHALPAEQAIRDEDTRLNSQSHIPSEPQGHFEMSTAKQRGSFTDLIAEAGEAEASAGVRSATESDEARPPKPAEQGIGADRANRARGLKRQRFLAALSVLWSVSEAAKVARVHPSSVYDWLKNPEFAKQFNAARNLAAAAAMDEARRLASEARRGRRRAM